MLQINMVGLHKVRCLIQVKVKMEDMVKGTNGSKKAKVK